MGYFQFRQSQSGSPIGRKHSASFAPSPSPVGRSEKQLSNVHRRGRCTKGRGIVIPLLGDQSQALGDTSAMWRRILYSDIPYQRRACWHSRDLDLHCALSALHYWTRRWWPAGSPDRYNYASKQSEGSCSKYCLGARADAELQKDPLGMRFNGLW